MSRRSLARLLLGSALLSTMALAPLGVARAQSAGSSPCANGCIADYALPPAPGALPGINQPFGVTAGADGLVWFSHGDAIGRITRDGTVKDYPIPTQDSGTGWTQLGPDRAVWFAERNGNKIGRMTADGRVTEYAIPSGSTSPTCPPGATALPQGIATGADGAVWFTEECGNRIGRLSADGQLTEYAVPTADSHPLGITAGPDGALWFVEKGAAKVGRITTGGQITEFAIAPRSRPQRITTGADGALWFTELGANKIGRMTPSGQYNEYPAAGGPVGITAGPDGALWFVEFSANKIGRMTTSGQVTAEYPIPTPNSGALQIAVGPDAALWFTEGAVNRIGRLQIPGTNARGLIRVTSGAGVSASFSVSFSSASPGQGSVLFGSGPGCLGLVETATLDLGAGTVQHTVVVTGNDLAGTVGDTGIQPGATYWYKVVTVGAGGTQSDDNGGACYRVTVPLS